MKNFTLFISLIFLAGSAFSQSLKILDAARQNVSNSNTIVTGAINHIIIGQLYVVNDTSATVNFKVKRIENNVLANTENSFCFNGVCNPPSVSISNSAMALSIGDTTVANGFYGEYKPHAVEGSSVITYVVFNADNINDSTYVVMTYQVDYTSISVIDNSKFEFSNPYPNPVISQTRINYNIPVSFSKATLTLRNLIGTKVKEYELSDSQGKLVLDLNDIEEGIYFYSLIVDGNVVLTRKLIRH